MEGIRLRVEPWEAIAEACRLVRDEVFVSEQGVPQDIEHDAADSRCVHVLAIAADGTAVGTGRLLPDGHIGRMAVRKAWRGRGIGGAVLALLIEEAREQGHVEVLLNAQVNALKFYRDFDSEFEEVGARFIEAGLEHQTLRLKLQP
jgi:predicted GNAT family N-acyltransferase